jgi:hypothetical protein
MDSYYEDKVKAGLVQRSGTGKFHLPEQADEQQQPPPRCGRCAKPLEGRQRRACSAPCRRQLSRFGLSVPRGEYEREAG